MIFRWMDTGGDKANVPTLRRALLDMKLRRVVEKYFESK